MKIQILQPEKNDASRYPKRRIIEEYEGVELTDVIEEVPAPLGGWLIAYGDGRVIHFTAENGKWRFRSQVLWDDDREESKNAQRA